MTQVGTLMTASRPATVGQNRSYDLEAAKSGGSPWSPTPCGTFVARRSRLSPALAQTTMTFWQAIHRALSTLLFALLLSACATGPKPVQSPEQFRSTHGFLHATIPQASAQAGLAIQSKKGGDRTGLDRHPEFGPQSFGLWLPPGEYEIPGLKPTGGDSFAPIRIERGRVTDLGALITVPLGGYEFMTLAVEHPDAVSARKATTEGLRQFLSNPESLHWTTDVLPAPQKTDSPSTGLGLIADLLMDYERHVNKPALNKALRQAKSVDELYATTLTGVVPATDEPGIGADQTLYFGAELGQIRTRRPDGQWGSIDTGTLQAITAVESVGDSLIAGTATGRILYRTGAQQPWTEVGALSKSEAVLDIDRVKDRWIVISATQMPHPVFAGVTLLKNWKVYTSARTDLGDLKLLRTTEFKQPVGTAIGPTIRGQQGGDDHYYFVNSTEELVRLDLRDLTWTSTKPPQDSITRFSRARESGMLTAFYAKGVFSKLNVSMDNGTTWKAIDTPSYPVIDLVFDDSKTGRAARVNMGAFSSNVEFHNYDASSNRWKKDYEAPFGCAAFLRDATSFQRICVTSGGSILNYVQGKWVVEFAVN